MIAIGALFLLGPLIVVPLGLRLIGANGARARRSHAAAITGSLPAAIGLGLALALPTGGAAAVMALPWLLVALVHLGAVTMSAVPTRERAHQRSAWIDLIGAGFLVVGAIWIVADRLGLLPFGFDPIVVRLTAVHFHFAGFGLLLVAGRLADRLGGLAPRVAAVSVALGVPLVALGFLGLPVAGLAGVLGVAAGGLAIGALQLVAAGSMRSSAARWLARLGGVSLFVTMPMAVLWQLGQVTHLGWIDLATMIRIHGALNALGFAVASLVAWTLDRSAARAAGPDGRPGVGALDVLRFNWPPYLAATAVAAGGLALSIGALPPPNAILRVGAGAISALAATWVVTSFVAAWWVFDGSQVTRWRWLASALGASPRRWVNVTTGFDDTTIALRGIFPASEGVAVDVFDPGASHERSILRARAARPPVAGALPAYPASIPVAGGWADAVLFLMAAHELREDGAHAAAFAEARRILAPGGRVVVVEHLRDIANALAFGPGVLHFVSRRRWVEAAAVSGLALQTEIRLTPFVRGFVLATSPAPERA